MNITHPSHPERDENKGMSAHETVVQWIKIALAVFAITAFIKWGTIVIDLLRQIELHTWSKAEIIRQSWERADISGQEPAMR